MMYNDNLTFLIIIFTFLLLYINRYPKFFSILGEMCGITVYDIDMDKPHEKDEINYNMTPI